MSFIYKIADELPVDLLWRYLKQITDYFLRPVALATEGYSALGSLQTRDAEDGIQHIFKNDHTKGHLRGGLQKRILIRHRRGSITKPLTVGTCIARSVK